MKSCNKSTISLWVIAGIALCFSSACNNKPKTDVTQKEIVETPQEINVKAEDVIEGTLSQILSNSKELPDSFRFRNAAQLQAIYDLHSFKPLWSSDGKFTPKADSLLLFIDSARLFGLLPGHYYQDRLLDLRRQLILDTSKEKKLDASLWAYNDLMMSSAFVQIIKDLKVGRLLPDSMIARDSALSTRFFEERLSMYGSVTNDSFAKRLEPVHKDYWKIRSALPQFLEKADFRNFTYVASRDSVVLRKQIYDRIAQDSLVEPADAPDSLAVSGAIWKYQEKKKIKADGKLSSSLVSMLNNTDHEKFLRIAINLDRFKQLQVLPEQHIWVNIPAFKLQLREMDSVPVQSKVCVGKPNTKTPVITSAISDMITYPKWTIPESIIKKEILPGLKKDAGYTIRKGYSIVDKDGNEVDPYSVNWTKYKEGIPYKVVQGSGDDNALGVLKFNFPNKFSVYLHDTNQRYLFSRTNRALSHGCVRVESWYKLATYILRNDSLKSANPVPVDSLDTWLSTKQKKYVPIRKPIPLFIRYFTCEVSSEGKLVFFEDIYGEDRRVREKFVNPT